MSKSRPKAWEQDLVNILHECQIHLFREIYLRETPDIKYEDGSRFDVMYEWFKDINWMRPLMENIGIALKRAEDAGWKRK